MKYYVYFWGEQRPLTLHNKPIELMEEVSVEYIRTSNKDLPKTPVSKTYYYIGLYSDDLESFIEENAPIGFIKDGKNLGIAVGHKSGNPWGQRG